MRPKVVIAAAPFFAVLLLLGVSLNWLRPVPAVPPGAPATEEEAAETTPVSSEPEAPAPSAQPSSPVPTNAAMDPVDRQVAELYAMGMRNDDEARESILAAIENPERAIREAALEAALQSGDRSIVPRLQEIADRTEDPQEQAAIVEAIDFINLPSLSEYFAERRPNASLQTNVPHGSAGRVRAPRVRPHN